MKFLPPFLSRAQGGGHGDYIEVLLLLLCLKFLFFLSFNISELISQTLESWVGKHAFFLFFFFLCFLHLLMYLFFQGPQLGSFHPWKRVGTRKGKSYSSTLPSLRLDTLTDWSCRWGEFLCKKHPSALGQTFWQSSFVSQTYSLLST